MLDVSVVIPVYRGQNTLSQLVHEVLQYGEVRKTPQGFWYHVSEVILVWDRGDDASDEVIRALASSIPGIRGIWLSRNFGQHAATMAGISASTGDWVVTLDEDGQHDPAYIGSMLDRAYETSAQLVYAEPSNEPPHGALRNAASRTAKGLLARIISGPDFRIFNSYRLVAGEVGRGSAAFAGSGVYLDVALSWVVSRTATVPVPMRNEGRARSGYTLGSLLSHFGRMVVSSGTRPLAFVSLVGVLFLILGLSAATAIVVRVASGVEIGTQGWASTFTALLVIGGLVLFSLGVIAQYLRVTIDSSLGKPLYMVVRDPELPQRD